MITFLNMMQSRALLVNMPESIYIEYMIHTIYYALLIVVLRPFTKNGRPHHNYNHNSKEEQSCWNHFRDFFPADKSESRVWAFKDDMTAACAYNKQNIIFSWCSHISIVIDLDANGPLLTKISLDGCDRMKLLPICQVINPSCDVDS